MANTVILALVDGMRPDGLLSCGHPFVNKLIAASASTMEGRTCFPSVTLPCHMSLFHSVDPERHGILTNTYVPQVRPIDGLIDQLDKYGKRSAMFYTWEELRDLARPGHAHKNVYVNLHSNPDSDCMITDEALSFMAKDHVDFLFLYLGETDEVGHDKGWMSDEYISAVRKAVGCIERVYDTLDETDTLIVTADHGGHGRSHGATCPEDMTIPLLMCGAAFAPGSTLEDASIKDIAPTIASLLGVPRAREWEGEQRA